MKMKANGLVIVGLVTLVALFTAAEAGTQTMNITPGNKVHPRGEIVDRMRLAISHLDKATKAQLWSGFTETGMWGADWPGRTLEAYSRVSLALGEVCTARFDEVGNGLLERQAADGAFHTVFGKSDGYNEATGFNKSNGFWFGNSKGLRGYIWAHRATGDGKYLDGAKKVGDYFIKHYFDEGQPGAPGSFWWIATESLCELYRLTDERKYVEFAQRIAHTIPSVNMGSQHTHSYLLSVRGNVQVHEILGDLELLNMAIKQHRIFKERIMWPGGGIVEHLGSRENYDLNYWFDEGCSIDDWLGLNLDLWRVTLDTAYMDMVERTYLNHLYYGQDKSGGFCGDRGVDSTREGSPWPFCCSMHGTRTLAELTQYIATTDDADIYLNVFLPASIDLEVKGLHVNMDLDTNYPKSGALKVTVNPSADLECGVKVRVPVWSRVNKISVNGKSAKTRLVAGYVTVDRLWTAGDTIEIELDMPLRAEYRNRFIGDDESTDYSMMSLWEGPRQLVYNQALNNHLWKAVSAPPALRFVSQTYGSMQKDVSVRETPLKIGDREYKKGLGTHSVSEIVFSLDGQFKEFISDIGIDACTNGKGAVRFKVCVDGLVKAGHSADARIAESEEGFTAALYGFFVATMDGKAPAKAIKLDVAGAKVLRLTVDDGVNGLRDDCADWAGARVVKADGVQVYLSDLPDDTASGMPWDWGIVELTNAETAKESDIVVTLQYRIGNRRYPITFNYLADLGYSLIESRPVLRSYFKVDPDYLNAEYPSERNDTMENLL